MPDDITMFGDWDKAERILNGISDRFTKAVGRGMQKTGVYLQAQVKRGIRDQAPGGKPFRPLSPITIAIKGSTKALIDTGDMLNSVTYKTQEPEWVFIGLLRTARSKKGDELANIGAIHEGGAVIKVTNKQRFYLMKTYGWHLKPSTTVLYIPARPFLAPVMEAEKANVLEIFRQEVARTLSGS